MTKQEWKLIIAEMTAHWPHQPVSKASEAVWFDLLKDQDAQAVREAVRLWAMEGEKFPPTGGQIRKHVVDNGDRVGSRRRSLEADAARGDHRAQQQLERLNAREAADKAAA